MTRKLLLAAAFAFGFVSPSSAENWPQWRGPKNDGHSTEKNLPAKWDENTNIAWKTPLPGTGSSTPCVWGEKMFLTTVGEKQISLHCIGTDGKPLWQEKLGQSEKAYRNDEGNDASASCSTDGKLVFTFVGNGQLTAHDFTGKKVWGYDVQEKYGTFAIQFGIHQTPVLYKDRLYVSLLHRKAQLLIAIEPASGKEIWKHERQSDSRPGTESPDVYSSPFIWENGDDALLISHGNDYCTAHLLTNGHEVWRVAELNPKAKYNSAWRAVSSPLVSPNLIVVPSCKKGVTVGVDPKTAKGTIQPGSGELWRLPKDTPDVPSPLLVDDLVYLMGEQGTLYCYDAKTGASVYSEKITNMRHRANPVYADGKIYLTGREGTVVTVAPGRKFESLATNKLPDVFTASPAISGGKIILRGHKYLWAISTK
jgi:outer membrane protein assembly factor BamB